jgi:alkyldihydroxyacetonephosphate synthase
MSRALEICRDCGGVADQSALEDENSHRSGAAGAWRNRFIRAPYYTEHAVARGLLATTFETSMTWERLHDFHATIMRVSRDAIRQVTGREGTVTCRFTHVYPDGPCLYFTLGGVLDKRVMLDQCTSILSTSMTATVQHGGTTTHHHAVGRFHRPFYDKQRPELFARALRAAKRELDPKGMMNPGVLIDP